jgi:sensor histidine kinase YesM
LPFVENCFKHGGKNEHGIFEIRIDLKLQTDTLHFTVVNSIREERSDKDKNRVGIGLKNIRDRLNHHYPGKFTLDVKTQTEYFVVELLIELR